MMLSTLRLPLAVAALSLAGLTGAIAEANTDQLAEHLHQLDPGGLVGGKSIVGTKSGQ